MAWWLRLTTFQEINFNVQQIWILAWCVKSQKIAWLCQQTFYFCSADNFSWSCSASCWIGAKFKIAVWRSDFMKRNFRGFTFTYNILEFVRSWIDKDFLGQTWHIETSESGIIIGAVNPNWSLKSISEGTRSEVVFLFAVLCLWNCSKR